MSEDSEKKEDNSEEKPIDYGWAQYIGGHIAYPKPEYIGVYFYNDRFSIWFTKCETWLRIPYSNIVHMENSYEKKWNKKHTYTKIEFKENSDDRHVVIDFENNTEIAQNIIYEKMPKPSVVEASKPSVVEASKPSVVEHLPYKSPGTTALIAFLGGIFGLLGIGHIYVGRVGRGIGILISGFIIYGATIVIMVSFGYLASFQLTNPAAVNDSVGTVVFQFLLALIIGYILIFILQIFNARKLAKEFNETVRTTGKEPW